LLTSSAAPPGYLAFMGGVALWLLVVTSYGVLRLCRTSRDSFRKLGELLEGGHPGGSFERLYLSLRLAEEQERVGRYGGIATVVCIGLDATGSPEQLNDPEAHEKVLEAVRTTVARLLRTCDVLSRHGKSDLLALLPETDRRKARKVSERLCKWIEGEAYEIPGLGTVDFMRLSIGIAAFPLNGETMDDVLQASRRAMQRARAMGRNTTAVSHEFIRTGETGESLVREIRGQSA
jgi:diguanylate cyclase (GGDEF)-like protein